MIEEKGARGKDKEREEMKGEKREERKQRISNNIEKDIYDWSACCVRMRQIPVYDIYGMHMNVEFEISELDFYLSRHWQNLEVFERITNRIPHSEF
jgi:hypothetical protein